MDDIYKGVDLQAIDMKSLSNDQWLALRQHFIRQAHAERSKVIAAAFERLWPSRIDWLGGRHKIRFAVGFPNLGKLEETT